VRAQRVEVLGAAVKPVELQELLAAERLGTPFMFLRRGAEELQVVPLSGERLVIGRAPTSDLEIAWDPRVSGIHAYLESRAGGWVIEDDGLSRNGTFVAGERLHGQRILRDGDVIQVGDTRLGYRDPAPMQVVATMVTSDQGVPSVSEAQRRVLLELCRPLASEGRTMPATNQEIAQRLVLSLPAVKNHLRILFDRFGLEDTPQNQKRILLAERALEFGLVRAADLLRPV
jgi:hypothetical protein